MAALKFHMKLHEELQFMCDTCGKNCPQKAYLQQHMQGAHLGGGGYYVGLYSNGLKKCINMKIHAKPVHL